MSAEQSFLEMGRARAEALLIGNGGSLGLLGSNQAYQQVWARDSMLCSLGLLLCRDPQGAVIHRLSLETLGRFQSPLGKISHNVGLPGLPDPALIAHGGRLTPLGPAGLVQDNLSDSGHAVEDTIHAGCVDGNLWYILGQYAYFLSVGDLDFLRASWPALEHALLWLRYQDSNECGLLEVHEVMDWADLFANRYNVLYDNVLYYAAWQCMVLLAHALDRSGETFLENARDVRRKINTLLWVGPESPTDWDRVTRERKEWLYPLKRVETELVERPFYLP